MANVQSYPKGDARKVLHEHDRTAGHYKNYVDKSRIGLNWTYDAGSVDDKMLEVEARCADIMQGKPLQEHTNVLSNWEVTYPFTHCTETQGGNGRMYNKPNDMSHCKKFFDEAYKFAQERYGKENVMVGYVHMDETTPHIDIMVVPEAISRKTGKQTVSSASLFTKAELRNFHKDLESHMANVFGEPGMILNGRTKGNYTSDELKQRTADEETYKRKVRHLNAREKSLNTRESDLKAQEDVLKRKAQDLASERQKFEFEASARLEEHDRREQELAEREREANERYDEMQEKYDEMAKWYGKFKSDHMRAHAAMLQKKQEEAKAAIAKTMVTAEGVAERERSQGRTQASVHLDP